MTRPTPNRRIPRALIPIAAALLLIGLYAYACLPLGGYQLTPTEDDLRPVRANLDPLSPWPKFRADLPQSGRAAKIERVSGARPWVFRTGKGIFSSPVVDADGTVYVGSADQYFYAISVDGRLKWKFRTGEIIDSAALLDDRGRVYFGSGDGHVYALDRATGKKLWSFRAHTPEQVTEEFGIKTYNVDWFEGNIAMLPNGDLLAPNDNYLVYALSRDDGRMLRAMPANEMLWSSPAVNPQNGNIFFGSCFVALQNVFSYDAQGNRRWLRGGLGTNAASPLLSSASERGAAIVGGFDGHLRAYAQDSGKEIWRFAARDHIYASPAQTRDGTIIQPSADGSVYAVDPQNGKQNWAFDALEPIRSSPAIDDQGTIYVGSGEGRLFAINADGSLRWAYRLIKEPRNDLNSSPALGRHGIYIAGESGEIFFVPYDYPLSAAMANHGDVLRGPAEPAPAEGVHLIYTDNFGALLTQAPAQIDANQPLTFTLVVRQGNETVQSRIESDSLQAKAATDARFSTTVSADGRFVTLVPETSWSDVQGGVLDLQLQGAYRTGLSRFGLKAYGGDLAGDFDRSFRFQVRPRSDGAMPYVPAVIGQRPGSAVEISRLAAPNPTMLPSWNQIGFDSLHYLAGVVESDGKRALLWVVPGMLNPEGATVVNPELRDVYFLEAAYDGGLLTLENREPFTISFIGSWDMPFGGYRLSTRIDPRSGVAERSLSLNITVRGDDMEFYGRFLKILGLTDFSTGLMTVFGGANLSLWNPPSMPGAAQIGQASAKIGEAEGDRRFVELTTSGAMLKREEHVYGLLLVDAATGKAIPANYGRETEVISDDAGRIQKMRLNVGRLSLPARIRLYWMVDTNPVWLAELTTPAP